MDPLTWLKSALQEIGAGAWLLTRAARGLFLDVAERDELARRRLAEALVTYVWRPLPTLAMLALLTGLIAGISAASLLKLYHAELAVAPALVRALAREVVPLLVGVFAAGRVSVELAARLGGMQIGHELEALETLGHDPARYTLAPCLAAIIAAAPIHTAAVFIAAWLAVGLALQPGAVIPWASFIDLTINDATWRAVLTGVGKSLLFLLIAAAVGAAAGSREARSPAELGAQSTSAFTAGLLGVFTAATLWTALL
jgi:ABC-type transporter Mla maintaining outer membrane lipid asymmetry permease subunit MlaE